MAVLLLITSSSSAPGLSHRRGGLLQTLPPPPWSKYSSLLLKVRTAAHFIPTDYNCLPPFRFVTFLMLLLYLHKMSSTTYLLSFPVFYVTITSWGCKAFIFTAFLPHISSVVSWAAVLHHLCCSFYFRD